MRSSAMLFAVLLAMVGACDKPQAETVSPTPQPEANPTPAIDTNVGETPVAQPPAQPAATTPADDKAKADEAQRQQFAEAKKKVEAEYAAKAEKWTPERRKAAQDEVAKADGSLSSGLKRILKSPVRDPENVQRDGDRHPGETLKALGLRPDMKVLEIGPGSGWYSEILAPVLAPKGTLVHLSYDPHSPDAVTAFVGRSVELLHQSKPELYAQVKVVKNDSLNAPQVDEPGTYDMVFVSRMLHNVYRFGWWDVHLKAYYDALKPGGILAIEQHRAAPDANPDQSANKGYLPEKWLIAKIESAGFKLDKKSEVNANPKDTKDYEGGVWVLPPTLAMGDKDRDKYVAIGESDRMTLKFIKPKK